MAFFSVKSHPGHRGETLHLPDSPKMRVAIDEYRSRDEPRRWRLARRIKLDIALPDENNPFIRIQVPCGISDESGRVIHEMIQGGPLHAPDPRLPYEIQEALRPQLKEALVAFGLSPDAPLSLPAPVTT